MRPTSARPLLALVALAAALSATALPCRAQAPPALPPEVVGPSATPPPVDLDTPLDMGERDTLLRLAWQTLVGHLTNHPIQDRDLEAYSLTPRLLAPRGCFVTLKKGSEVRGNQGEVEATRPLYQQVIVFTRRAATRDPRFLPLTDRDLGEVTVEIAAIGRRDRVEGPAGIQIDRHGIYLEKWGRRALFLPGQAAAQGWGSERALDELCRQAALPAGAWKQAARIEIFTTDVVAGPQPPPPVAPPAPAETPTVGTPAPAVPSGTPGPKPTPR